MDDSVIAPFVLNPGDGLFSVFAWIEGGAPGQVILSQAGGADWLMVSSPDCVLMTDLKLIGRSARALTSSVISTDGNWHRVGLSWDGFNRMLCVDDVEVTRDVQAGLTGNTGGLQIGAGKGLELGTFWTGLIDDVRIYKRAVQP